MLKIRINSPKNQEDNKIEECITFNLEMFNSLLDGVNVQTPGSWLHPHQVDDFIEIVDRSSKDNGTSDANSGQNRVVEFTADAIADTLVNCDLEGPKYDEPIDYIEIKRIDKGQCDFPTEEIWRNIFKLEKEKNYCVAPNGSLFVSNENGKTISLEFQTKEKLLRVVGDNNFFAFTYSVFFHFKKPFQEQPVYCVVDPIVQVRSRPE